MIKQCSGSKYIEYVKKNNFKDNKKIMAPEEIKVSWVSERWIFVFNLTPFASNLSYVYLLYVDLDPYSEYEYGSTKLLNTNLIWIRIHNTAENYYILIMHSSIYLYNLKCLLQPDQPKGVFVSYSFYFLWTVYSTTNICQSALQSCSWQYSKCCSRSVCCVWGGGA